mmetsp:Transcript_14010/g.39606  ORF Transcript_14010/g.39606 Transcript_14010/m.39606 type:complete len:93 (+) Transcript_14010:262-540(+)
MKDYLACLKQEKGDSLECKLLSKKYLECRMDKNLMAREDLSKLGFRQKSVGNSPPRGKTESMASGKRKTDPGGGDQARQREKDGFIPGVRGK